MRARVVLALSLVLLLVPACFDAHETTGDATIADADVAGVVGVAIGEPHFTTCACHHGCGPGIDGRFTLVARSTSSSTHTITITRVAVDSIGSPGGPYVTPTDGYFRVNGSADGSITIPPGATVSVDVSVYLDIPVVEPGTDTVVVDAIADGAPRVLMLPPVTVESAPGC